MTPHLIQADEFDYTECLSRTGFLLFLEDVSSPIQKTCLVQEHKVFDF